jgi:U32 family peptidase
MTSHPHNRIPELLAPAGTMEALRVVLESGADSVYIAGKLFGMRQHASWLNFSNTQLSEGIQRAHDLGKKIYIAVNNLLTSKEIRLVQRFLDLLAIEQPDAVIIQDLGILDLCRRMSFPIPLHASTMMNVHDIETARYLGELGISRIITSRDISLRQSVEIQDVTGIECEVFLHGDMCIAHSGQCLTSGILTGESSNRGKCLKPCRWQFDLVDLDDASTPLPNPQAGDYLLARKDLSLLDRIVEVAGSGIASLKIEGRTRTPDYLRFVVSTYRQALDQFARNPDTFQSSDVEFEEWHWRRIRNHSTCYTFGNPQAESIDYSGIREPRIFSIAIEQQLLRPESVEWLPLDRPYGTPPSLSVHCSSVDVAVKAVNSGADCVRMTSGAILDIDSENKEAETLKGLAQRADLGIVLDRILTPKDWEILPILINKISILGMNHVVTSHLGVIPLVKQAGLRLVGDYSLNVLNSDSFSFLLEEGFDQVSISLEANLSPAIEIPGSQPVKAECVIHGPVTGMLSEHCVINASLGSGCRVGTCRNLCGSKSFALRDRLGQLHHIITDRRCRNHILLPLDLCALEVIPQLCNAGIGCLRIEGQYYPPALISVLVDFYRRAISAFLHRQVFDFEIDEAFQKLLALSPRGLSLSSYGNQSQEVSLPGESIPDKVLITRDGTQDTLSGTVGLLGDRLLVSRD